MAMYTCYYDASGKQGEVNKPLVVVGLLSTEKRWLRCEREWEAVLAEFGVPYMHMHEFAHFKKHFASWKGDETRRANFLRQLILVLKRGVHKAIQYRMVPEVFHSLDQEYQLTESWGGAYGTTAAFAMLHVEYCLQGRSFGLQLQHIFEQGDDGQGDLLKHTAHWQNPPTSKPKIDPKTGRHFVPFQGADLLAYESHRNIEKGLAGKHQVIRRSFAALEKHIPWDRRYLDEETLRKLAEVDPESFPRRRPVTAPAFYVSVPLPSAR